MDNFQGFREEVLVHCIPKHLQHDGFLHVWNFFQDTVLVRWDLGPSVTEYALGLPDVEHCTYHSVNSSQYVIHNTVCYFSLLDVTALIRVLGSCYFTILCIPWLCYYFFKWWFKQLSTGLCERPLKIKMVLRSYM